MDWDLLRCTRVGKAVREALGDPESALDFGQHQHPGIRRQAATIEGGTYRPARDRREGDPLVLFHGALRSGSE